MTIKDLQRIVLESDQSEGSKEMQELQRKLQADHSISGPALNTNHYPNIIIQYKDVAASTTL